MPYINQKALSAYWMKITGGSYIVDIEAVGMKCPNCNQEHADPDDLGRLTHFLRI